MTRDPSCCDTGALLKLSQFVRIRFHEQRKCDISKRTFSSKPPPHLLEILDIFPLRKNEALHAEGNFSCMVVNFLIRGLFKKNPNQIYSKCDQSGPELYYFLFPHNCVSLSRGQFHGWPAKIPPDLFQTLQFSLNYNRN